MKTTVEFPAFDAGARTVGQLSGDGTFSFAVGQARGVACGLGPADATATITDIRFGFLIEGVGTRYRIISDGAPGAVYRGYSALSRFEITRANGVLRAYVGGTLVATDTADERRLLFGDCSLFAFGDAIEDAKIETRVANEEIAGDAGIGRVGASGAQGVVAVGFAGLGHIKVVARALEPAKIGALWARGSDTANAVASVGIGPLDASGADFRAAGEYNFGRADLGGLAAGGMDRQTSTTLRPAGVGWLSTRGTDKANAAYGFAGVGVVRIMAILSAPNRLIAAAPAFAMRFEDPSEDVRATLPVAVPVLVAHIGLGTALPVPVPALTARVSGDWSAAALPVPFPDLVASAVDGTGQLAANALDVPVLRAAGVIASVRARLPVVLPALAGHIVDVDAAWGTLPVAVPTASGAVSDERIVALLPAVVLEPDTSYLLRTEMALPVPVLVAVGRIDDARPDAGVALAALAVNLSNAGVTVPRYPAFARMAPGFGLARDGTLYRLEGKEIYPFARIRFPASDFGAAQRKRVTYLYVYGRTSEPLDVEVQYDEGPVQRYVSPVARGLHSSIQRVKLGGGYTFCAASVAIESRDGGSLNVGAIELLVDRKNKRIA